MDTASARRALAEQARRATLARPPYIETLHPAQQRFWNDRARFKAALCGRRAGKTQLAVRGLLQRALAHPEVVCAYMGVTREAARRLAWSPMRRLVRAHALPVTFNKVELTAYCDNGAEIWILGADKEEDIDKVLGPAYKLFVVDEAASYRAHLEKLVEEAVEPALADLRGELWMMGSPGLTCCGYFYDVTTGQPSYERWSVHRWTLLDNPFFRDGAAFIEETRASNGWGEEHPTLVRQYFGRWVEDSGALVYRYAPSRNAHAAAEADARDLRLVLAMDFGVVDSTAFCVLGYSDTDPAVSILESYARPDMSPSDVAEHVRLLRERFVRAGQHPEDAFERIVGDSGGMGKAFCKELDQRHTIHVKPAAKMEKLAYIDHMNGDFASGRIKVVTERNRELVREWQTLPWKDTRRRVLHEKGYDDHLSDAALYGWRECRGYLAEPQSRLPDEGTEEYNAMVEEAMVAKEIEEHVRAWWDRGLA